MKSSNQEELSFDSIECIDIAHIKELIGIAEMPLYLVRDNQGKPTNYCSYFSQPLNLKIIISTRLVKRIKEDRKILLDIYRLRKTAHICYVITYAKISKTKKYRNRPRRGTERFSNYNDWRSDTFYALTDGQFGTYDEFRETGGDMDYLSESLGY